MPRRAWSGLWAWYERHYTLNIALAAALFTLQLVHLVWLAGAVVTERLTGVAAFHVGDIVELLLVLVDWTEIPAIVSVSLVYLYELRRGSRWRPILFLVLLNSQYLHIFWITDEVLVRDGASSALPGALAWAAIMIDYLELPVVVDTLRKAARSLRGRGFRHALRERPSEA